MNSVITYFVFCKVYMNFLLYLYLLWDCQELIPLFLLILWVDVIGFPFICTNLSGWYEWIPFYLHILLSLYDLINISVYSLRLIWTNSTVSLRLAWINSILSSYSVGLIRMNSLVSTYCVRFVWMKSAVKWG